MRALVLAASLMALAFAAMAQQPQSPSPDARISGPMMQALQAEINLRDAALKAIQEDAAAREKQWQDWFKEWCGESCAPTKVGEAK